MATVVQKFGGSSLADPAKIRFCAGRVAEAAARGDRVCVVVSAMGDTTDDLITLAEQVSPTPSKREMDQLLATGEQISIALMSMALQGMGIQAVSLTGAQCGIKTDRAHTRARITGVASGRLERELAAGRVPVVAGFQGACEALGQGSGTAATEGSGGAAGAPKAAAGPGEPMLDITTLGRGGSDTTAVAIAAAVRADVCEIYTDVHGVYTADPRVVPHARLMETISYDEMMEAASQGAKVMHLRAVELGKKAGVPIRVLHSMHAGPGTLITDAGRSMETQQAVSTVALKTEIGRVTITGLPHRAGVQREIFERIARSGISVDDIIQTEDDAAPGSPEGGCTIVFTVDKPDLAEVREIMQQALKAIGRGHAHEDLGLVKVSAVGVGMQSQPGVAAKMFQALAEAGIRIANITTSEIKISCILDEADGKTALRVVHDVFELGKVVVKQGAGGVVGRP